MSRKSNNLKKRLRIEQEQFAGRQRELDARRLTLDRKDAEIREHERKAVALTIRVEYPPVPIGDLMVCQVGFRPEMFYLNEMRSPRSGSGISNISYAASHVAHELADKVRRAIVDFVENPQRRTA